MTEKGMNLLMVTRQHDTYSWSIPPPLLRMLRMLPMRGEGCTSFGEELLSDFLC